MTLDEIAHQWFQGLTDIESLGLQWGNDRIYRSCFEAGFNTAKKMAIDACGICNGLGYDGMGGEEQECAACAPIRKIGKP